jgi:hypothetical protein
MRGTSAGDLMENGYSRLCLGIERIYLNKHCSLNFNEVDNEVLENTRG